MTEGYITIMPFCNVTPCSLVDGSPRFGGAVSIFRVYSALKMEAENSSETSVLIY
jgi:hypothetical protein